MNVSNVGTPQIQTQTASKTASLEEKRMMLQSALLRKALESSQTQEVELARQTEGKGQIIDIRV